MTEQANVPKSERIFICGFMATGKTTVGSSLAKRLRLPFQDLDRYLERKEGMDIKAIFSKHGEEYFRVKEREYLQNFIENFRGVLALGGGSIQNEQIAANLVQNGILVFLETSMEMILERIGYNDSRPIALDAAGKPKSEELLLSEMNTLYLKRKPLYEKAQIQIGKSGSKTTDEIVNEIIKCLKNYV